MKNYILLFFLCFLIIKTHAQTAKFVWKTSQGKQDTFICESATITFKDTSISDINHDITDYTFNLNFEKPLLTSNLSVKKDTNIDLRIPKTIRFTRPGWYHLVLTMSLNGNVVSSYTDSLQIRPRPNAWFSVADTFELGDLNYRFLSGKKPDKNISYTYHWYYNDKNDSVINTPSGLRDLLIVPFDSGRHVMNLLVTDDKGCRDEYSQSFFASKKIHFPQAFTPNGDGRNDFFQAQTNGRDIYNLQIFNSRGLLIFKSESRSIIWDGYDLNGKKALGGIYYFVVQSVQSLNPVKEVGYVMLLREK